MSKLTLALIVSAFLSAWYVQGIRWDNDVTAMKLSREKEKKEAAEQGEQKASAALINQRGCGGESRRARPEIHAGVKKCTE